MPLDPSSTTPDGDEENLPLWRKHFSIDSDKDAANSRRQFVAGSLLAGGTMACAQVALNSLSKPQSDVEGEATVESHGEMVLDKKFPAMEVGETQLFHYPDERSPCLLVKLDEDNFVAFAQKCTHLACPVIPDLDKSEFHCPCHHGTFDLATGSPTAGPPRRPLPRVPVRLRDDGTLLIG